MAENESKENAAPVLWVAGDGFAGRKKKLIIPKGTFGHHFRSPSEDEMSQVAELSPEEKVQFNLDLVQFLKENVQPIGFVAWTGYKMEGLGRGVVFFDGAEGLEADSMQIEYLPANAVINLLEDQGLPDVLLKVLVDNINQYKPEEECLCLVYVNSRLFPVVLSEKSPIDSFNEMVKAANSQAAKEEGDA